MLRTPPQLFDDFEAGLLTREQLHAAMAFHARTVIEEVVEARENPVAAWWEGVLARKTAARLAARHGERRLRAIFAALAALPDFLPAQWLWNAHHPDVPLFCFLRLRREPLFRLLRVAHEAGGIRVTVEYGPADPALVTREEFTLAHRRHVDLEVTARRTC